MEYKEINIEKLLLIANKAGDAVMEVYSKDFEVEIKADNSPLTEADTKSNMVIISGLKELYPDIPVISEENKLTPYEDRKNWKRFWLIDPIDGTKEFIKKNGEFTINIALIEEGEPVIGIVYAPALNLMYVGAKGLGTFKLKDDGLSYKRLTNPVHYRHKSKVIVVGSRSHLSAETVAFVDRLKAGGKEVEFLSSGSSLKFCLVAEGKADVYPRFGPTMEWDTGAAHAVAKYAGRTVINAETQEPLIYNKENLLNPWFIVE